MLAMQLVKRNYSENILTTFGDGFTMRSEKKRETPRIISWFLARAKGRIKFPFIEMQNTLGREGWRSILDKLRLR